VYFLSLKFFNELQKLRNLDPQFKLPPGGLWVENCHFILWKSLRIKFNFQKVWILIFNNIGVQCGILLYKSPSILAGFQPTNLEYQYVFFKLEVLQQASEDQKSEPTIQTIYRGFGVENCHFILWNCVRIEFSFKKVWILISNNIGVQCGILLPKRSIDLSWISAHISWISMCIF
jgi:hypothetical protein